MPDYAAVDLGATSGRVLTGRLRDGRVELTEAHRFENRPVRLPDGLRWNLLHLFTECLDGLRRAGAVDGIGVDTWGVDYALLDAGHRVLGLPFHYRDDRTEGMVERAFERLPAERLYAATGIQTMPINTVFQLLADEGSAALDAAQRIALVPDLLALWLCGELANERTNASTTGLLDARSGEWAGEAIARARAAGAPVRPARRARHRARPAARPPRARRPDGLRGREPRHRVGVRRRGRRRARGDPVERHVVAARPRAAGEPVLSAAAREANLTNERGIDGTTRLLKNVMGLWLLEESRARLGRPALRRAAPARRGRDRRACRCSTPTTRRSCAPAT